MTSAADNLKLLAQLQDAIQALPDWRVPVVVEDEWGQKFDLVRAFAIGKNTDDLGLVLKIRMHAQHPDA
jgi:hypothetical protein